MERKNGKRSDRTATAEQEVRTSGRREPVDRTCCANNYRHDPKPAETKARYPTTGKEKHHICARGNSEGKEKEDGERGHRPCLFEVLQGHGSILRDLTGRRSANSPPRAVAVPGLGHIPRSAGRCLGRSLVAVEINGGRATAGRYLSSPYDHLSFQHVQGAHRDRLDNPDADRAIKNVVIVCTGDDIDEPVVASS